MRNAITNPDALFDPAAYGFSHVVTAPPGRLIFIAGQGGEDRGGTLADEFEGQVRQAFANLGAAVSTAGATLSDVVKITTFIVDHDQSKLETLAGIVRSLFGAAMPAQTLVPVQRLALDGMLFEVEAVAVTD